jgi:EAL domain-containing protein (putative c-di-GMP-specific phosphodiesterase class I)
MSSSWRGRLSEGRIVPHYQPIISVETQTISAYEALGRHQIGLEVRSLGPFFQTTISDPGQSQLRRDVDRALRRAALTEFATQTRPGLRLFLNIMPRLMLEHLTHHPDELPWTLQVIGELGVDPKKVVIELTEEAVGSETASLRQLIDVYRDYGCAIAVDDVGAEASNLDRIGYFEPDIIKIDALMLRRSLRERSFRQVLKGVGAMAEGLGASLLFEGVETEEDVEQALAFGARYLQGWYFSKAAADFLPETSFTGGLTSVLRRFGHRLVEGTENRKQRLRKITEDLGHPPGPVLVGDGVWGYEIEVLNSWGHPACRVFLTDRSGFQVSPNYETTPRGWKINPLALGRCRASRPYFPGNGDNRWSVSEAYYDVNDRNLIRTYSRPTGPNLLLFVDVLEIENQG